MLFANNSFTEEQVDRLFPFHIFVDEKMKIRSVGKKLQEIVAIPYGEPFSKHFRIQQLPRRYINFSKLKELQVEELTLFSLTHPQLQLTATIEPCLHKSMVLMVCTPDTIFLKKALGLQREEEKYSTIIDNMNLGLIEVDLEFNILHVNHTFCDMSGFNRKELIGKNVPANLLSKEHERLLNDVKSKQIEGTWNSFEIEVKNKNKELCYWVVSAGPLYDYTGNLIGSIGILLDISKQKRFERQTFEAKAEAERSASAKEIFLANMSHEIRTPMNAILGLAQQLQKTELSSQQKLFTDAIETSADNLLVIINDILDFSKIEAGKVNIEKIGFDIRHLIQHSVHIITHRVEEKGLRISSYIDERMEKILLGDPYRLNQVLVNLLSNAVKFTEKGSITIHCELMADLPHFQQIQLRVHDTGIGMSKDFLNKVFDIFHQEHDSTARQYGGTGLGMSISKQLIELMGGEISIESVKDEGTIVSLNVTLPKGIESDLPKKEEVVADLSILKGKQILLVEDNSMNRLLANIILSQYGATITEALNGEEAVATLNKQRFDLVLMDVQMPVMDGLQATRAIRKTISSHVPIIALTANAITTELDKCIVAGMDDYLIKPFNEQELIRRVAKFVGKEMKVRTKIVLPESEVEKVYNFSKLKEVCMGDENFMKRMIEVFKKEVPEVMAKMVNAYYENNLPVVKAMAHRIRPSIDTLSVDVLRGDIQQIENLASLNQQSAELNALIQKLDSVVKIMVVQMDSEVPSVSISN